MKISLLNLLQSVDTPTVCNAIEVAQGKRGFNDFTRGTMLASDTKGVIVGYAVTAQIAAIEPPTEAVSVIRERRMSYYKAMSENVKPSIAVVEDLDYPNCIGAFWGEVNTTIHKGFGMSGALTNGVMRDLGDMAEGFPVVAGSIGPSHGFVHVRSVNQPINIFGMNIKSGDLVHADRHGAVVVPTDVIDDLEASILKMQQTERLVLDPARKKGFDFNAFETAWNDFEKART
ncbi:RraA family protein [Amylibacter sp.]|jgi:regulator of RNase E activity RraA|nr:RraA family protein [Amylibacter sp.]MDA7846777.1 RraA family protein [Amylibacter sp.]MDA9248604.1 RraA family protein [Amylibacter sp.]MDA9253570.1 RraA family protein [Amylibacter sp.]MDA9283340.1 RraA family protein [Amylibacter sp.]|tara:strand:+ start:170 stop:862 length:693 start_codon:yes stop_codon:yes gene_type:complete